MASRTLGDMVSAVARAVGGGVPNGDIQQAIFDKNREIHARWEWPWLYKETTLTINGTYTTGTISWASGTTVTGTGTTWDTSWRYKRISFGGANTDYTVATVTSPTTLTLLQTPNIDAQTDVGYTIYQDVYEYPSDYAYGRDIGMWNQEIRLQVFKIPRLTLSQQNVAQKQMYSNYQQAYCDAGDSTGTWGYTGTPRYCFQLVPPPGAAAEFKFVYGRTPPDLTQIAGLSVLPEDYVEILQLFAAARVRVQRGLRGAQDAEAEAMVQLRAMRRRVATQYVVNRASDHGAPWGVPDSSFTDGIFAVKPWV